MEKIYFEAKVKKSPSPIEKVIQDLGIVYPNDSLGFLHAVYAKVDGVTPNKNDVILAKSVKQDVPKLRFTQANRNHNRAGHVLGTILDSWVNDKEEIEIVFSFYKSLYPQDWQIVEKAIDDGNLNVSFELTVNKEDVEVLKGGVRKVKRCSFDGVGLLFPGVAPAYDGAHVLESANKIVNKIFEKSQETIFASIKDVIIHMEKTSKEVENLIKSTKEDDKVDDKANKTLFAKAKEIITKELGEEAVKDWSDENFENYLAKKAKAKVCPNHKDTEIKDDEDMCSVCQNDKKKKEMAEAEETRLKAEKEQADKEATELKAREDAEAKEAHEKAELESKQKEEAELKAKAEAEVKEKELAEMNQRVERTYRVYDVITDSEKETMDVVETVVTEVEENGKLVKNEQVVRRCVYASEKVEAIKSEYEAKISEKETVIASKDEEIKHLNTQVAAYQGKEKAEKVESIRAELGNFVKDLSDEQLFENDKVEIARLKKENADLKAEKTVETASTKKEVLKASAEDSEEADEKEVKKARKEALKAAVQKAKGKK